MSIRKESVRPLLQEPVKGSQIVGRCGGKVKIPIAVPFLPMYLQLMAKERFL
jgi:hypothetical protein